MGILDRVRASKGDAPAPTTPPATPAPTPAVDPADVEARKAAFIANEAKLKAEAAAPKPAGQLVMLTGEDAKKFAAAAGYDPLSPGSGIQTTVAAARAAGINVTPPDAPASGTSAPAAEAIPQEELATMPPAIQQAAAEVAATMGGPSVAQATMGPMVAHNGAPPVDTPKKRGRKLKAAAQVAAPAPAPEGGPATTQQPTGLALYVNCEFDGVEAESLDDYVGEILRMMAEDAKVEDVRLASGDSPMAFGRWKAALELVLKSHPPKGAWYVNDVAESEIRQVAVAALWSVAAMRVRGRR